MTTEYPNFEMSKMEVLRRFVPLELDDETLEPIEYFLNLEKFPAGAKIISQGQPGEAMYFIALGTVEVSRRPFGIGRPEHLASLGRGDVVGEMALVNNQQRNADVIASEDVSAYRLTRDDWYIYKPRTLHWQLG